LDVNLINPHLDLLIKAAKATPTDARLYIRVEPPNVAQDLKTINSSVQKLYTTVNTNNSDLDSIVLFPFSKNILLEPNLQGIYQNPALVELSNPLRSRASLYPLENHVLIPNLPTQTSPHIHHLKTQAINKYKRVCVGGTFDHIHAGHKLLLSAAILSLDPDGSLIIGLSDEPILKNKLYKELIASYKEREGNLKELLQLLAPKVKTEIVPLNDPYGPTVSDKSLDCLVVSEETEGVVPEINKLREEKGWSSLPTLTVELIQDPEAFNTKLSSSMIRKKLVDKMKPTK